jgi:hypothetical protein
MATPGGALAARMRLLCFPTSPILPEFPAFLQGAKPGLNAWSHQSIDAWWNALPHQSNCFASPNQMLCVTKAMEKDFWLHGTPWL